MTSKTINVKAIRIDGGTQSRVEIDNNIVTEYADAIRSKVVFPPMVVFHDGADYWLADGFHRWHAYNAVGKASADVDVRAGTVRDAILFSFGANGAHGLRRSNADKRKAVESMLADPEWAKWSDHKISEVCGVSHPFVAAIRNPKVAAKQQENRSASASKKANSLESDSKKSDAPLESDSSQTPKKQAEKPEVTEHFGPDADELEAQAKADAADAVWLQKLLDSDDKLAAAHAEIKRLNAVIATLEVVRDGYMNGRNEAIKMVKRLQTRLDKLERAAA